MSALRSIARDLGVIVGYFLLTILLALLRGLIVGLLTAAAIGFIAWLSGLPDPRGWALLIGTVTGCLFAMLRVVIFGAAAVTRFMDGWTRLKIQAAEKAIDEGEDDAS